MSTVSEDFSIHNFRQFRHVGSTCAKEDEAYNSKCNVKPHFAISPSSTQHARLTADSIISSPASSMASVSPSYRDAALLLAEESTRVLESVEPALTRRLLMQPGDLLSVPQRLLQTTQPVLSLHLIAERDSTHDVTDDQRPEVLRAFAELAAHSQRLSAFPRLKAKFWKKLGFTSVFIRSVRGINLAMLARAGTPSLMVCVGTMLRPVDGMCSSGLLDSLYSFLTSRHDVPVGHQLGERVNDSPLQLAIGRLHQKNLACGLSFTHCQLNSESLQRIQSLLDNIFADPNRHFDIDVLDLSDNAMGTSELEVVAHMVQKIKSGVYSSIRELRLNNVICDPAVKETPRPFLEIVRAVFDTDSVRVTNSRTTRSPCAQQYCYAPEPHIWSSSLKSVSWSGNRLCPKYFAALGSALRYGSPVVEELLSSVGVRADDSLETKRECWRWLAFGFFYPRLKQYGGSGGGNAVSKLRSLGRLELSADALETFERTLRDPMAELVYGGRDSKSSRSPDAAAAVANTATSNEAAYQLMVCTVKRGATIDIADQRGDADVHAQQSSICEEKMALEALCERADGSVCVVVPGVGLGWVRAQDVERFDKELLEHFRGTNVSRYDMAPTFPMSNDSLARLEAVLGVIGPQFRSLDFSSNYNFLEYGGDLLGLIIKFCVNLQHLNLRDSPIAPKEVEVLLDALRGKLGDRLLSLDIGSYMVDDFLAELCGVLSAREKVPALQELRLAGEDIGNLEEGISSVHELLSSNLVIRVVELNQPSVWVVMSTKGEIYANELGRLENIFGGQQLQQDLPLQCKLAFLSVIANQQSGGDRVSSTQSEHLGWWLLQQIFAFAESGNVRRSFHWHGRNTEYFQLRYIAPAL